MFTSLGEILVTTQGKVSETARLQFQLLGAGL
jgi:hypothetical protein